MSLFGMVQLSTAPVRNRDACDEAARLLCSRHGAMRRTSLSQQIPQQIRCMTACAIILITASVAGQSTPPDTRLHAGKLLYADDFTLDLAAWRVEMEKPGTVTAKSGVLDIDVPAGMTVWLRQKLDGPVMIQYEANVISANGPTDRVSDLNSFWMATDRATPKDLFEHPRSGKFAEYNTLNMYYVGLGGNGNTTTRFRRYIGDETERPLLPQNDLSVSRQRSIGIVANKWQTVTLIADGHLIQYWRGTEKIFEMVDPEPYTQGWFGIRTTKNHMQVRHLRIVRLIAN